MHGKVVTPLDLAAWLGVAIAKALVRLWERLCEIGRVMRREFVRSFHAARNETPALHATAEDSHPRLWCLPDRVPSDWADSDSN